MLDIQFDAEGWKAVIADKFTFANVKMVTQGIAAYVNSHNLNKRGIVIGYDNRFLAERFAHTCARVLVGNGIRVILLQKPTPTPVAVYAVRARDAGGAIIFTGGDTPPEYQGLKFIPEYAGPALPEVVEELETEIHRVLDNHKVYELSLQEAEKLELVEEYDADREYRAHIMKMLNPEAFKNGLKVVVDPMFGAGVGYLESYLEALGCKIRVVHGYVTCCSGIFPKPIDQNLEGLKRAVKSYEADLGLALDGKPAVLGWWIKMEIRIPNHIMYLLLDYLLKPAASEGR